MGDLREIIRTGEELIARQELLIADLLASGHDATDAKRLLGQMQDFVGQVRDTIEVLERVHRPS